MTVTIELKPETEKRIAERAEQKGLEIENYLEEFIEDSFIYEIPETRSGVGSEVAWSVRFERFLAQVESKNYPVLPDEAYSRESIYEDRY